MGILNQLVGRLLQKQKVAPVKPVSKKPRVAKEVEATKRAVPTEEEKKQVLTEFAKKLDEVLEKKRFVTVTSETQLSSSEAQPKKTWSTLRTLFSEAPGAIQCATVIKNRMLGGGFYIKPIDEEEDVDENDKEYIRLNDFIDEPNSEETLIDVWSGLIQNYLCYGTAYLEKVYDSSQSEAEGGMLKQVFLLDVEKMKVLVDKELREVGVDLIVGFSREITNKRKKIVYDIDEIFHCRRPAPDGNIYGQATLENHQAVLSMVIQALTYNVNFLRNNGKGPLQVVLPEGTGRAEADAFSEYYEKKYTGPANAGRTTILFGGAEAKELGSSIKDMDYLNLMKFCKKEVAGMFGVPLVMISDPEGTNRASSIEERKGFHVNYVLPEREKLLHKFNKEIVKEGLQIEKYEIDIEELDTEDQGKLTEEAKSALGTGLCSLNEAAEYSDWERIDEEWADKKIIVNNGKAVLLDEKYFQNQDKMMDNIISNPAGKGSPASAPGEGKKPSKEQEERERKQRQEEQERERRRKQEQKKSMIQEIARLREDISKHLGY